MEVAYGDGFKAQVEETVHTGTGSMFEQPPLNVGFSELVEVCHPPAVVVLSSFKSGNGLLESIAIVG